jgi:hypothetical protein
VPKIALLKHTQYRKANGWTEIIDIDETSGFEFGFAYIF